MQRLYSKRDMRIDFHMLHITGVSSHDNFKRNCQSSQRFSNRGSGADSVCELNELNRLEGTSFPTPLNDDGGRSRQNDATAIYVGAGTV